jgi:hypothetical protein
MKYLILLFVLMLFFAQRGTIEKTNFSWSLDNGMKPSNKLNKIIKTI